MRNSTDHRLVFLTLCLAAAGCAATTESAREGGEETGDGPDDGFTVPGGGRQPRIRRGGRRAAAHAGRRVSSHGHRRAALPRRGRHRERAGPPLFDIARRLDPAVDVVVAGHTNAAHVCDVEGKLVTSAASAGRLITDIDLTVDEVTGEVVAKTAENVIVTRTVDKAAPQTALIARWEALAAPFANRVVGTIAGDLVKLQNPAGESPLGDVIADAQLSSTRATGVRIAFMNPGGVRTDLLVSQSSGGEAPGELTYGEVFAVQPFSNIVVTVSLTGAQIVAALEQQWVAVPGAAEKANVLQVSEGFTYTWDAKRPIGSRILAETVKLDGVVLDPTATYRVAMNNFIADGGDGFSVFKAGTDRVAGAIDVDAFSTYVGEKSPLAVPATTRIVRLD